MFDYQAGERYKITLIFVGVAGLMAGVFFTLLLGSTGEAPRPKRGKGGSAMIQPGSSRRRPVNDGGDPNAGQYGQGGQNSQGGPVPPSETDSLAARDLIQAFAPLSFDMSATTANDSQTRAMEMMTSDFAQTYRTSIWTPELAQLVQESGVRSSFTVHTVSAMQANADGSIAVRLTGTKVMTKPDGESKTDAVNMEYLCQKDASGRFKIAGIKDQ